MKKLIILLMFVGPVQAGEFDHVLNFKDALQILAGGVTAIAIHELGHEAVAQYRGDELDWSVGGTFEASCVTPENPDCNMRPIALGGFGAQIISNQVILSYKDKLTENGQWKNSYWPAIMFWNTVHHGFYIFRNEDSENGAGDFAFFDRDEQRQIEAALVFNALATWYRWPVTTDGKRIVFRVKF